MDTVSNYTPNTDIFKKAWNRFFLIKLKIFYIWALNFPHVYWNMLRKVWYQNFVDKKSGFMQK